MHDPARCLAAIQETKTDSHRAHLLRLSLTLHPHADHKQDTNHTPYILQHSAAAVDCNAITPTTFYRVPHRPTHQ